jgi:hypothetical protein
LPGRVPISLERIGDDTIFLPFCREIEPHHVDHWNAVARDWSALGDNLDEVIAAHHSQCRAQVLGVFEPSGKDFTSGLP